MELSTFYAEGDIWTVAIESSIPYQAQVKPQGNLFQYVEKPYRDIPTRNNPPEDDDLIVTSRVRSNRICHARMDGRNATHWN